MSSVRSVEPKEPMVDRLKRLVLKPTDPDAAPSPVAPRRSVEELEAAEKSADDKERLIGLLAAPFAAAIAVIVMSALVTHDPSARLADGAINKAHVSVSIYHTLLLVLMAMSVVILALAWFRKRLYLSIVLALYGLAIFNLHYWGFGVPFVLVGAWMMVRAYRVHRDLKEATADIGDRRMSTGMLRPHASKRYTPPGSR